MPVTELENEARNDDHVAPADLVDEAIQVPLALQLANIDASFATIISSMSGRSFLNSTDFRSVRDYRVHCWFEAQRGFVDYKAEPIGNHGRKSRLPKSQILMAHRAGMSFDQVRRGLEITVGHLKSVEKRLDLRFPSTPHPDLEDLTLADPIPNRGAVVPTITIPADLPIVDVPEPINLAQGAAQMKTENSKKKRALPRHDLRGDALALWIREIFYDYLEQHGRTPTKIYFEKEFGISHKSVVAYWPEGESESPPPDVEDELVQPQSPLQLDNAELIERAAEHAFGDDLVAGAYLDHSGKRLCDEVLEVDGEYRPMIKVWRRHLDATRNILAFASKF